MSRFFHDISAQRKLPPAVLAAALNTGATRTVLLNSERIEQCFGSYGIEILVSDANVRRANLYSLENNKKTCRTYAVVHFDNSSNNHYAVEHEQVLTGGSLGAIFKAQGWIIRKETIHIGCLDLRNQRSSIPELMRLTGDDDPALHVYRLLIARDGQAFEYATIAEAHHPDYLSIAKLQEIFPYDASEPLQPQSLTDLNALFSRERLN